MTVCPLFADSREDAHPAYRSMRDRENIRAERARERCENLWIEFAEFSDRNFLSDFPINLNQRWFEMYLTVLFVRKGMSIRCSKPGPDICLNHEGKRIWIEAVCPNPGNACRTDSVPELVSNTAQEVPFSQYALRIRSSLEAKQEKYRKYLDNEIVNENDITAVAISASGIPFLRYNMEEIIQRAVYGLGDKYFYIDDITKKYAGSERAENREICKSSGNSVGVIPFRDGSMKHISAVIGSSADTTTDLRDIGKDCVLYRNRTTTNPWRGDCFPWMAEFPIVESEGSDIVQSLWRIL